MAKHFDNALKALWTIGLPGLCGWLDVPVDGDVRPLRLSETLPPVSTEHVLDLFATTGPLDLLHLEAQAHGEKGFEFRNLDYLVRILALPQMAGKRVHQHVVLLGPGRLATGVSNVGLAYHYTVHRLADEDPARFLAEPTLMPFATLGRLSDRDRPAMFAHVLDLIAEIDDPSLRELVGRVTETLAAVRLPPTTIRSIWKESPMSIPSLFDAGHEAGHEVGREDGRQEVLALLLRERFGEDAQIDALARRLAQVGPAESLRAIEQADSIDDLL